MQKKIIVIGGGMAGTSAAYFLTKKGYDVTIIEKNDRLGGRIRSQLTDGIAMEYGAGFITNMYPNMLRFLKEQGLKKYLYPYKATTPGIVRDGSVHVVSMKSVLGTVMLSWGAKSYVIPFVTRALWHWNIMDTRQPWKLAVYDDASIDDVYSSSSGKEFLDYVLQPILSATFYWSAAETKKISKAILLFCSKALLMGGQYKMQGGLQQIPEKAAEGSLILLRHAVKRVQRESDGAYWVEVEHNGMHNKLRADGIVCATTASVIPQIFSDLSPRRREFFENIHYSSAAYVGRTYKKVQLRGNRGIVFSDKEGLSVVGLTSLLEPAVDGTKPMVGSVKISTTGNMAKNLKGKSDEIISKTLIEGARLAHETVFVGSPKPLSTYVWHWDEALPILNVGYFKKLTSFVTEEAFETEPLVFAGDYLGGPFMEGAFTNGTLAAQRLDTLLDSI
ncbi:protoporphyrinogen oxidase [soil metagenome]